ETHVVAPLPLLLAPIAALALSGGAEIAGPIPREWARRPSGPSKARGNCQNLPQEATGARAGAEKLVNGAVRTRQTRAAHRAAAGQNLDRGDGPGPGDGARLLEKAGLQPRLVQAGVVVEATEGGAMAGAHQRVAE